MWCKKPSKAGSLCGIEAASEAEEVYVTFEIRDYWRSEQLQRRSLVNAITDSSAVATIAVVKAQLPIGKLENGIPSSTKL